MGIEKAQLKRDTAQEIGAMLDDVLEDARIAHSKHCGAVDALNAAAKGVEHLLAEVDKQVTAGVLDLEQSKLAKDWLVRAVHGVQNMATKARGDMNAARGKVEFGEKAVAAVKKVYDRENAQVAIRDGGGADVVDLAEHRERVPGSHPGGTIKQRRLAEEVAERGVQAPPEAPEPTEGTKAPKRSRKAARTPTAGKTGAKKTAAKKTAKKTPRKKPVKKPSRKTAEGDDAQDS